MALVKKCPACATEHPPQSLRCACGVMLVGLDLVAPAASVAPSVSCPHADCAQPNEPGRSRCVYCDRPLTLMPAATRFSIAWPWGETCAIENQLLVGRVAPAAPELIARLEAGYDNVSRRHALLRAEAATLTIEDLGSANGTFIDEVRVPPHAPVRLHRGATVRFAASLTARIETTA